VKKTLPGREARPFPLHNPEAQGETPKGNTTKVSRDIYIQQGRGDAKQAEIETYDYNFSKKTPGGVGKVPAEGENLHEDRHQKRGLLN